MTSQTYGNSDVAMDRAVANCFGALLAAICASADDWRLRAAEALIDRDDTTAQECLPAVQRITEAAAEVEALYLKWKDRWPIQAPAPVASRNPATTSKRPGSKLRVYLNSEVIECSDAAETFARAIAHIGLERVAQLGKVLSGIALIGKSKTTGYQGQFRIGDFYVCTHSNTQTKKHILEEIAAELGILLRVEIASENQAPPTGNGRLILHSPDCQARANP